MKFLALLAWIAAAVMLALGLVSGDDLPARLACLLICTLWLRFEQAHG